MHDVGDRTPTYGELIDLLDDSEKNCSLSDNVSDILYSKFKDTYPGISIGRCKRFHATVMRIAAPTRSSLRGPSKLCGSPLTCYRKKKWIPRIRNPGKQFLAVINGIFLENEFGGEGGGIGAGC